MPLSVIFPWMAAAASPAVRESLGAAAMARRTLRAQTRACALWALLALLLALGWQASNVYRNYSGNWTALFCAGTLVGVPGALAFEHIFEFPGYGFDGQYYHSMAHDPLMRRGFSRYIDLPRHRYRRVLFSAAAYLLAFGRDRYIDAACFAVMLGFTGLGAFWVARIAVYFARSPAWGLLFLAVPSTLIALDRMVIDAPLTALCAGYAFYTLTGQPRKLYVVAALACLTRETGLILVAAICASELLRGRFRGAAAFATAALPCAAWYAYVQAHTATYPFPASFKLFWSLTQILAQQRQHLSGIPAAIPGSLDLAALAGIWLAFVLAFHLAIKRLGPLEMANLFFALLGMFLLSTPDWHQVYDFGRVFSPSLLLPLAVTGFKPGLAWLPLALVVPRTLVQILPQVIGLG